MTWRSARLRLALCLVLLTAAAACLAYVHRPRRTHRCQLDPTDAALSIPSASEPSGPRLVNYLWEIKPVLADRCYGCHAGKRHRGGLRLDTAAALKKGGDSGPAILPGNAAGSLLVAALTGADNTPQMPPSGEPLDERQIQAIKTWIDQGAPAPEQEEADGNAIHWAFRPPQRPAVPSIGDSSRARNPIDLFLLRGHADKGLTLAPPAAPGILLRRLYLDLTGLPPTPDELQEFLADSSDAAYEKTVDALLASPRYAERWARHWMDVWRYSDPDGRKSQKSVWWSNEFIWRWRDWIVRSLARDKGYDRMVQEMLAGDELAPGDADALAGTGFLARNWFEKDRNVWLNTVVEHTGKAFLGLTIHCARCHDHKFDPVTQQEYYRFRAVFEPHDVRTDQVPLEPGGPKVGLARAIDLHLDLPTYVLVRGDDKNPDKSIPIVPGVPSILGGSLDVHPLSLPPYSPDGQVAGKRPQMSSGRRLALARWLCDPHNPLTARVAVNHVWLRHFGRGLVDNPADFGLKCRRPAQHDLLDWLAVEFVESGWSLKHLHRMMVTSALYRASSSEQAADARDRQLDPENRFWWRMESRPLEAEAVRDGLLHLAGNLDATMGGPALDYPSATGPQRRSLYYRYSREDKMEFLTVFNPASVEECYRRQESIVPQQALALANSDFVWEQARRLNARFSGDDEEFVAAAFAAILCRPPTEPERAACRDFLCEQARLLAAPERLTSLGDAPRAARTAREFLVHALLNHNDFVTIR
jgi:hypothetical protein